MEAARTEKTILVTGAAGFLGSHLCDRLLALDSSSRVIGLDSLFCGSVDNVEHLAVEPRFEFVLGDVTRPFQARVDQIYNLACPASPVQYQSDPIHTIVTSFDGALNMLDLAKANHARILQASTSEVYGDPTVSPQHEDYRGRVNVWGPRACYDEGKRAAESLFYIYRHHHRVDARVVRIFNTYGPRMQPDDGRVVSNFIIQALTNQPITLYGEGSQTRSFCYVDDLVEAMVLAMNAEPGSAMPVNIGNPYEITVAELADNIVDLTGSRSQIQRRPLPVDDPLQRRPDISRARELFGWQPKVELREGLTRTVAYFETVLRNANRLNGRLAHQAGAWQPDRPGGLSGPAFARSSD